MLDGHRNETLWQFMVVTVKCRKGSVTCIGRGVISLSSYMIFVEISFAFMKGIKK